MITKNFVFTAIEAAIISKFNINGEALIPQLGISFRMTPSEMSRIIEKLQANGIIEPPEVILLKLTKEGKIVKNLLENHSDNVTIVANEDSY